MLQMVSSLGLAKQGPILGTLMTKAREWQYAHALQHSSAADAPPQALVAFLKEELPKIGHEAPS
jgi:hypothetical protein